MSDIASNIRHDIFIIVVEFVLIYLCSRISAGARAKRTRARISYIYLLLLYSLSKCICSLCVLFIIFRLKWLVSFHLATEPNQNAFFLHFFQKNLHI